MPTFVQLVKYSEESIRGIGQERLARAKQLAEANGGRLLSAYGLLGQYDVLAIWEFPDEKAAAKVSLALAKLTHSSTQTMAAIPIEEFIRLAQEP